MSESVDVVERALGHMYADAAYGRGSGAHGSNLVVAVVPFVYPDPYHPPGRALEAGEVFATVGQRIDAYLQLVGAFREYRGDDVQVQRADGRLFVEKRPQ